MKTATRTDSTGTTVLDLNGDFAANAALTAARDEATRIGAHVIGERTGEIRVVFGATPLERLTATPVATYSVR